MGNDQHRKLQLDQLRQITVHRAVTAQDENGIRCFAVRGHPQLPVASEKRRTAVRVDRRTQPKNGSHSHFAPETNKLPPAEQMEPRAGMPVGMRKKSHSHVSDK